MLEKVAHEFAQSNGRNCSDSCSVNLHDASWIPTDGIGVKICSWVEPEVELLLSVSLALAVHICVKNIRVTTKVSQKFEVYFIMSRALR